MSEMNAVRNLRGVLKSPRRLFQSSNSRVHPVRELYSLTGQERRGIISNGMNKEIILRTKKVAYTLRKSTRAQRMRLAVYPDGSVIVTTPYWFQETAAERFIREKTEWLLSKLIFFKQVERRPVARHTRDEYLAYKEQALALVRKKVAHFAAMQGCRYNKISVKNQKTCWGSCSRKANLNFNYRILFLPEHMQDYIIAHELCHLKEFNHSKQFWKSVGEMVPDYAAMRGQLKRGDLLHNDFRSPRAFRSG